ncbi:flippase-like domain-containing protein [Chitinophagaceae bacterium LB-8]|uniref:Flippase-like domain-containing protein n=1 Tax=Paraflavisolibacter caeni TaxID=2982496 RepID=A0A9X2XMY1_9BACT|nr:lysylphosphatidylglycerol synthase domain-containing protein [Paraflavisolibacter caeni]MCU7547514.1 flippase-like domain-containing protein [Paraflavisolibacter caeni]
MQRNKNIKIFINYFLGPILFLWLAFSIYRQIEAQPQLEASWLHIKQAIKSYRLWYLLAAVVLIFFNWAIEAWKWKLSIASFYDVGFWSAFKAILCGVSFSVTTPNRVGEYFGRMRYLPDGSRLKSISVTLVGSWSQLLVTVFTGMIAFIFLKADLLKAQYVSEVFYEFILFSIFAGGLTLTLLYFQTAFIGKLLEKWLQQTRFLYLVQTLGTFEIQLLIKLLLLSFLRYLVFVSQYYLLFALFGVLVPVTIVWNVLALLFLTLAVIPSISLVEVGLRGEISLQLMGLYSANSLGVGLTSVTIWFLNLVLPAIIGSILFLGIKLFKGENEV